MSHRSNPKYCPVFHATVRSAMVFFRKMDFFSGSGCGVVAGLLIVLAFVAGFFAVDFFGAALLPDCFFVAGFLVGSALALPVGFVLTDLAMEYLLPREFVVFAILTYYPKENKPLPGERLVL